MELHIELSERQERFIREIAQSERIPLSAIVRVAIDFLANEFNRLGLR